MERVRAFAVPVRSWLAPLDRGAPVALKLGAPIVAVLVLSAVAGAELTMVPTLRAEMLRAEERRALTIAEAVAAQYESHGHEREELSLSLSRLVQRDASLRHIRIYRVVGGSPVVWASSRPADVGSYRPEPHDLAPLRTGAAVQEIEAQDGEEVLETVQPLRSAGVLDATVGVYSSLDALRRTMADVTRRALAAALAAAAVQATAVVVILAVVVIRPIDRLHRAALRVAAGDLTVRLGYADQPPGRDEIAGVAREFDRMVVAVAQKDAEVRMLSVTDGLTGLLNRRAFDAQLASEIDRAKRLGYALTLSLIDLDDFKAVNDSLGHVAGDDALRRVGRALTEAVRRTDIVVRYGGDEFAVIHPGCDAAAAATVGERARAAVQQLGIRTGDGRLLSASAGIAEHAPTLAAEDLISSADAALYRAKARGGGVEVTVVAPRAG